MGWCKLFRYCLFCFTRWWFVEFKFVDETEMCDRSNERLWAILRCCDLLNRGCGWPKYSSVWCLPYFYFQSTQFWSTCGRIVRIKINTRVGFLLTIKTCSHLCWFCSCTIELQAMIIQTSVLSSNSAVLFLWSVFYLVYRTCGLATLFCLKTTLPKC